MWSGEEEIDGTRRCLSEETQPWTTRDLTLENDHFFACRTRRLSKRHTGRARTLRDESRAEHLYRFAENIQSAVKTCSRDSPEDCKAIMRSSDTIREKLCTMGVTRPQPPDYWTFSSKRRASSILLHSSCHTGQAIGARSTDRVSNAQVLVSQSYRLSS